jgi:hypothetical protein
MSTVKATNLQHASSASPNIVLDSSGNATMAGTMAMASSFLRNRIINGNMYISQRAGATTVTVTAGTGVPTASTGYPCVDRFFVYSTGANVTAAQVSGSGSNRNLLQVTGAASVTAVGIGQRIEALNSYDLAGQTCTLAVDLANSLLTTVTWTASYATTADTFGTIGTPTKTQIATGTFTVTSTLTRYSVNISVPAAATTGIEILFTVGAQTSGTFQVGNVQLEVGSVATPFERRMYGQELQLAQRYFEKSYDYGTVPGTAGATTTNGSMKATQTGAPYQSTWQVQFKVTKRTAPTFTVYNPVTGGSGTCRDDSGNNDTAGTTSIGESNAMPFDASGSSAGFNHYIQWTAAAEL